MKWWRQYSVASFCLWSVAGASVSMICLKSNIMKSSKIIIKKMSAIDWRSTNLNQIVVISSFHFYIPAGFYREHQTGDYYTYLDHPLPQRITSVMWYLTGSVSACNHDSLTCHNGRALISHLNAEFCSVFQVKEGTLLNEVGESMSGIASKVIWVHFVKIALTGVPGRICRHVCLFQWCEVANLFYCFSYWIVTL